MRFGKSFSFVAALYLFINSADASECRFYRDSQSVPHVRAEDQLSLFGCFGFAQARDRLWQMDFFRRMSQGRAAEVLGKNFVKTDFQMRLLGLDALARRIFGGLKPETQKLLISYAEGVNRGRTEVLEKKTAYEFEDFGYTPEPWEPYQSIAVLLLQSFDQTRRGIEYRLTEEKRKSAFGDDQEIFSADGMPWDSSILKKGEYRVAAPNQSAARKTRQPSIAQAAALFDGSSLSDGSNSWVVSPARSATGEAWFANDPHLGLRYPPFWHWIHLSAPGLDVMGGGVAGVPMVVSGFNRNVSWGPTNSYLDVMDVFYVPEEELESATHERPWVWMKVLGIKVPIFFKTFRRTSQGWPVLPIDAPKGRVPVLRWTGFELTSRDFESFFSVMMAGSARSMDEALSKTGIPSWNFVFADRKGSIGYRAIGRVPKMAKDSFGFPDKKVENGAPWGILSPEEMPAVFNPSRGFIATANNRQWPADSHFYGGRGYKAGFRAFRIEELLSAQPKHDEKSLRAIQCDMQSVDARFLAPLLLKTLAGRSQSPELTGAVEMLGRWERQNFQAAIECEGCVLYRLWLAQLFAKTNLDETALYRILAQNAGNAELRKMAYSAIQESFDLALNLMKKKGPRTRWGQWHLASFDHLAGPDYRPATPIGSPGDEHSVSLGRNRWDGKQLNHESGASHRLIVRMSDPPEAWWVLFGPNIDLTDRSMTDPRSPWMRWSRCEYQKVEFPLKWESITSERIVL